MLFIYFHSRPTFCTSFTLTVFFFLSVNQTITIFIIFAAFFLTWTHFVQIPCKFEIIYEAQLLFSSYFYNLCWTTEGINRHFLISFHQSYTQLCTCAVCRIVLKGHTNKSNLSPADSIPTRCSIAPAKTHNNSPAPPMAYSSSLVVCVVHKPRWVGLIAPLFLLQPHPHFAFFFPSFVLQQWCWIT